MAAKAAVKQSHSFGVVSAVSALFAIYMAGRQYTTDVTLLHLVEWRTSRVGRRGFVSSVSVAVFVRNSRFQVSVLPYHGALTYTA